MKFKYDRYVKKIKKITMQKKDYSLLNSGSS